MSLNRRFADWRGKRVWIIGASSGIGRATAKRMLERGARVAVSARSAAPLDEAAAGWPSALALPLDVLQPATLARATPSPRRGATSTWC